MRLIDADALKADYGMADDCKQCEQNVRECQYERIYTKMDFCGWIDDAETIEVLHWIPCSERMPDDLEEVNITWVNHDPEPYYDFVKDKPFTASAIYYRDKWYWYSSVCVDTLSEYGRNDVDEMDNAIEVIAWMPLPEPYNGES